MEASKLRTCPLLHLGHKQLLTTGWSLTPIFLQVSGSLPGVFQQEFRVFYWHWEGS